MNVLIWNSSRECGWYKQGKIIYLYQSVPTKNGNIPVAVFLNPKAKNEIAVLIVGGPAGSIMFPNVLPRASIQEALSEKYRTVYIPAYSGTQGKAIIEDAEIEEASSDIVKLLKLIYNANPMKKIDLIGESIGATVSAKSLSVMSKKEQEKLNKFSLIGPFICSPFDFNHYFERKLIRGVGFSPITHRVRVVEKGTGAAKTIEDFDSLYLIQKFFGPANIKNDLAHYLDKLAIKPKIVMGSLDKKIYCGDEAYLKAFTAKYPTTIIQGMDHVPANWSQLNQITRAIE